MSDYPERLVEVMKGAIARERADEVDGCFGPAQSRY